jgi:hypothetical protein
MATFADNVFEAFSTLRSGYRFLPARVASGKRFASLVRQVTEDVFAYVFVRDERQSGANIDVDLWVAPPETPDDSLETLYVGYKIRIGSEYDIDDAFFAGCEQRVIHFLPCVDSLGPLVQSELVNPPIRTKRWNVYQMERQLLSHFTSQAAKGNSLALAVQNEMRTVIHESSVDSMEKACQRFATEILRLKELDKHVLQFYEERAGSLASALANHLYVRALGLASSGHS